MPWRSNRARTSRVAPQAHAICDRCGFRFNHVDLAWQYDWMGPRMGNKGILVCQRCLDLPFEHNRTILIPADPMPIANPRPEFNITNDNPQSPNSFDPLVSVAPRSVLAGANLGNLTGGAGLDAPYVGIRQKPSWLSAWLRPSSTLATANWVAKNWSATPGLMPAMPPLFSGQLTYLRYGIGSFSVVAPTDQSFVGNSSTARITFSGWDGSSWHTLWSGYPTGTLGETVTATSSQLSDSNPYYVHAVSVFGDGINAAAIANLQFNAVTEGVLSSAALAPTAPLVSS